MTQMLVLMDIEWCYKPTQIAAVRVDENWNAVSTFSSLIRPAENNPKWGHVSYAGAEPTDFEAAPERLEVFGRIESWLRPDDILCFWVDEPAMVFRDTYDHLLGYKPENRICLIRPVWIKWTGEEKGSPYDLAKSRLISVPIPEHCSANDVEVLRRLLQKVKLSRAEIALSILPATAKIQRSNETKCIYLADMDSMTLHFQKCDLIPENCDKTQIESVKSAVRMGLKPCTCCEEEYWRKNGDLVQSVISRSNISYVFSGNIFHLPDCARLNKIPYTEIRGTAYYETCIRKRLRSCPSCNPTAADAQFKKVKGHKTVSYNVPQLVEVGKTKVYATRNLNGDEKRAIQRYNVAVKERQQNNQRLDRMTVEQQKDAHTLTQTRFAFWASEGYKTFHLRNCRKLDRLSNLRGFSKFSEARRAGYLPCKLCKPTSKHDITISVPIFQQTRRDESIEDLDKLCEQHGFQHSVDKNRYFIETPAGRWWMNIASRPVAVYHINKAMDPENVNDYHRQERVFLSLIDTFEYIRRHDQNLVKKE